MNIKELQKMVVIHPDFGPLGLDKAKEDAAYFVKQDMMEEISKHIKIHYVYDAKRHFWMCIGSFRILEDNE